MPITVPQFQYQQSQAAPIEVPQLDLGSAVAAGTNIGNSIRGIRLKRALSGEIGDKAVEGEADALDKLYSNYGQEGIDAANSLMKITAANKAAIAGEQKAAAAYAKKQIVNRAEKLTHIIDLPEVKARRAALQKYAMDINKGDEKTGRSPDPEHAEEVMDLAQNPDPSVMDNQLESWVGIAQQSTDYLKNWDISTYGDTKELRKKTRTNIDTSMKALNTRIGEIQTSYGKIENLVDQAKAGNRTAISSVLVALVKLQDPNSAVLVEEMRNALNQESPLSAALSYAKGDANGEAAIKAAFAKIDPLAPQNIDATNIRATAKALVQANIRPMQAEYENNLMQAENLSKGGAKHAMTGNFGQRLLDMNQKFFTEPDDVNSRDLTYEEINKQRGRLGLRPLQTGEPLVVVQPEEVEEVKEKVIMSPELKSELQLLREKQAKEAGNK